MYPITISLTTVYDCLDSCKPCLGQALLGSSPAWVKPCLGQALLGSSPAWVKPCLGQALLGSSPAWVKPCLGQALLGSSPAWVKPCLGQALPGSSPAWVKPCLGQAFQTRFTLELPYESTLFFHFLILLKKKEKNPHSYHGSCIIRLIFRSFSI